MRFRRTDGLIFPHNCNARTHLRNHFFLSFYLCFTYVLAILSLFSLHVYCFYVYASRVFYFLFRGFSSLFRLFRGKKKNPLRKRIDSCQFDFAQLFLGNGKEIDGFRGKSLGRTETLAELVFFLFLQSDSLTE